MRQLSARAASTARKYDGQVLQPARTNLSAPAADNENRRIEKCADAPDKSVQAQRITFRDLAKFVWPDKTDAHLAYVCAVDPRTARRWLCEDNEPPAEALGLIMAEMMKRYGRRGD